MFQLEDLLLTPLTPFVTTDTPAVVPQLDHTGIDFRLNLRPRRQWGRIGVRQHLGATQTVHRREASLRQAETFLNERQQLLPFN
jgi:hypothetical protein